jgi:hypothetical protein
VQTPYKKAQLDYLEAIRVEKLGSTPETKRALAEATKALLAEVRLMRKGRI